MKIAAIFAALVLFLSSIAIVMPDYAEAARMGGGRSFGSRPYMSTPAQAPRSTVQPRAGAAATQMPGKSGMLGGLAGGLLAGTLLGSLLGGNGFAGGGFMDLILLAVLAFIGFKLYQRFRAARQNPQAAGAGGRSVFGNSPYEPGQPMQRQNTSFNNTWGGLSGQGNMPFQDQPNVDIPAGFDVDEFLRGAKMAYNRLQKSWDKRDLADISQFATPAIIQGLQQQMAEDPNPGNTEIMLVNAQLLGVEDEGQNQRAQVYFDVLMRERPDQATPENAREIWHFLRQGPNGMWKLDGIQQVD